MTETTKRASRIARRDIAGIALFAFGTFVAASVVQWLREGLGEAGVTTQLVTALAGLLIQVGGIAFQRFGLPAFLTGLIMGRLIMAFLVFRTLNTRNAVRNEVHHINPGNALLFEHIDRLAFLFAENGHQHVRTGYLFLAGGLHMENRPLQHTLEPQCWLCLPLTITAWNEWCG